jgi:hypothetical protein
MCGIDMPVFSDSGPSSGPPGATKPPMKKSTRNWLIVGILGGGVVVVYYVMRARSSAATNATGTTTDPSIDPSTGIPYAEEDSGALGAYGTSPSLYGYTDPSTGAFISGVGAGATGVVTAPSTNASWAQQVEAYLQNLGYNPTSVAAALGKYLTGQSLSADQAAIVAAAQGFYGNPPQGAPPILQTNPSGNGTGGGLTGKNIKILGRSDWFSAAKDTLGQVKLGASGWYKIHGQRVYYSKAHNTIGFDDPNQGNKWVKRTL